VKPPSGGVVVGSPVVNDREMAEQGALIEEEIRNQLGDKSRGTCYQGAARASQNSRLTASP
jgi:hypothetical protein